MLMQLPPWHRPGTARHSSTSARKKPRKGVRGQGAKAPRGSCTPSMTHSPWQAPVRMLGMKPRRQGCGCAGQSSQGRPQARPTVAQHSALVHVRPVSWRWHPSGPTWLKQGPVR